MEPRKYPCLRGSEQRAKGRTFEPPAERGIFADVDDDEHEFSTWEFRFNHRT
jgi:hypothetical protein